MTQPASPALSLWQNLVAAHNSFAQASRAFLTNGGDRIAVLRPALRGPERATALVVARSLAQAELSQLLPELVFLASFSHGSISTVRELILSLPRDLVLGRIEQEAEPLLREGTYDEYRRFLELYEQLDEGLTAKLARRAAAHFDADVREAGEDYIPRLARR